MTTTARLDIHGQRHDGTGIAQGPHLAYLSSDRRYARCTQIGEAICVGINAALGHDGRYGTGPAVWLPVDQLGLDPQLVAPPLP